MVLYSFYNVYIVCIMFYMAFKWFYIIFVYGCLLFVIRVHMVFIRLCMDIKICFYSCITFFGLHKV